MASLKLPWTHLTQSPGRLSKKRAGLRMTSKKGPLVAMLHTWNEWGIKAMLSNVLQNVLGLLVLAVSILTTLVLITQ